MSRTSVKSITSRVVLEVDLRAIRRNFRKIRRTVAPAKVMCVLKADGYGLGVLPVAGAVASLGCHSFGVAELKEAEPLLKNFSLPVQVLGSLLPAEVPTAVRMGVICPIDSLQTARRLSREGGRQKRVVRAHILLDTGMGRLGVPYVDAAALLPALMKLPHLKVEGIYSHFPDANNPGSRISPRQLRMFRDLVSQAEPYGLEYIHMANSDAINNIRNSYFNLVRTGINLYGVFDLYGRHIYSLDSSLTLRTSLISVRRLPKGHTVGYGCTHRLKKDGWVGTIPAGYADGVPLAASNRGRVLINGRKYPVIGRVSMDYTTIDLGPSCRLKPGARVILIGRSGRSRISVEDWARIKDTHPYEIICSLGKRVERIYRK